MTKMFTYIFSGKKQQQKSICYKKKVTSYAHIY